MNWKQLRTILWLRWRLTRNQWSRTGALNAVITLIAAWMGLIIALAAGVGGIFAGALALADAPPETVLVVWDCILGAFLLFWVSGIMVEVQRSETIDLGRLLHLPVSLRSIFVVNYLASHFTFSLIFFLPGMMGLSLGLMWGKGWPMALLVPLVLSVLFMVTAWTYCLRGWLVSLMVNQRRRRAIVVGLTMTVILMSQAPNLYFNVLRNTKRNHGRSAAQAGVVSPVNPGAREKASLPAGFLTAHRFVPPMWVAGGAMGLAQGNAWPSVGGMLAATVLGALGLMRAYRSTMRFYQGSESGKPSPLQPPVRTVTTARSTFMERRLRGVPEEAAPLVLLFFRSMMRAPEVKMMLGANLAMPLVFAAMFLSRGIEAPGNTAKAFIVSGAVAAAFLGMLQIMFNQFGFDRDGFRALVLLPVRRRHILLAKNLGFLPIGGGIGLIFLVVIEVALRVPVLALLAGCCQLVATFLLISVAGNFFSVVAPYRVGVGSLKPTKAPAKMMLIIFGSHLLFPVVVAPIFIAPGLGLLCESQGWFPAAPVNLLLSLLWLGITAAVYRASLEGLGKLLQRREREILQRVTHEVE